MMAEHIIDIGKNYSLNRDVLLNTKHWMAEWQFVITANKDDKEKSQQYSKVLGFKAFKTFLMFNRQNQI